MPLKKLLSLLLNESSVLTCTSISAQEQKQV